jgi:hypothetical protein
MITHSKMVNQNVIHLRFCSAIFEWVTSSATIYIYIRCRLNSLEEHSWHSSNSELNLIIDLIQIFYINWGKRQDNLKIKFENLYKEHK